MEQPAATSDVTAKEGTETTSGVLDIFDNRNEEEKKQYDEYFKTKGASLKDEPVLIDKEPIKETEVKAEAQALNEPEKEQAKNKEIEENYKRMAHEERQRRQEAAAELAQLRARYAQMEQSLVEQQARRQQEAQRQQVPAFDEDPLGHLNAKNQELAEQIKQQQLAWHQQQEYAQRQIKMETFKQDYRQKLVSYQESNKDVDLTGVYNYLYQQKIGEYEAQGFGPEEARNRVLSDELALVSKAYNDGVNPGERIYALAQRLGYKKAEAMPSMDSQSLPNPSIDNDLLREANEKLDRVEKGMKASKTLGSGNQTSKGGLSLDQILSMNDDDFYKYTKDPNNWKMINQKLTSGR